MTATTTITPPLLLCVTTHSPNICHTCGKDLGHPYWTTSPDEQEVPRYTISPDDPDLVIQRITHPDPARAHLIIAVEEGHEDDFITCEKRPIFFLSPTEREKVFNFSAMLREQRAEQARAIEAAGGEDAYWALAEAEAEKRYAATHPVS